MMLGRINNAREVEQSGLSYLFECGRIENSGSMRRSNDLVVECEKILLYLDHLRSRILHGAKHPNAVTELGTLKQKANLASSTKLMRIIRIASRITLAIFAIQFQNPRETTNVVALASLGRKIPGTLRRRNSKRFQYD